MADKKGLFIVKKTGSFRHAEKSNGLFIVVEGIDGSGKTLQAKMLAEYFRKKKKDVLFTHEPTRTTKLGRYIEKRIRKGVDNKAELLDLYTQDREAHLKDEMIPALKNGKIVICDRYSYSTLAYQLPKEEWNSYINRFLRPDLALIYDVSSKEAMKRINSSIKQNERRFKKKAIFEKEKFLRVLRKKYLMMKGFKEVRIIDSSPNPEKVFEKTSKEVEKFRRNFS